jgi:ATP-dependent protease HslVU (ClpYQ) peptidase subunit
MQEECERSGARLRPSRGLPAAQRANIKWNGYNPVPPAEITESALKIAGEICIYTNGNIKVETLDTPTP